MDFDLDLGQWIVIGLSAFLFVWFVVAGSVNRRRGTAAYRWLYRSLEQVGKVVRTEWIGSVNSGARLVVEKAVKPFRQVEALYLLEPREFLPYWVLGWLRGKRDQVVIKITLRSAPKCTLEIQRQGFQGPKASPSGDDHPILEQSWAIEGFLVSFEGLGEGRFLEAVKAFMIENGATVQRISLRQAAPHLEVHARMEPLILSPAESYLVAMQKWFQEA